MASRLESSGRQDTVMPSKDAVVNLPKHQLSVPLNSTLAAYFAENYQQIQAFAQNVSSTLLGLAEQGALICKFLKNSKFCAVSAHDPDTDLPASIGYEGDSYSPDNQCLVHGFRHTYYQDPYTGSFYYVGPFNQGSYGQNRKHNHMGHSYKIVYNRDLFRNEPWHIDPYYLDSYHHPPGNYYLHPRQPQPNCRNNDILYHNVYETGNQQGTNVSFRRPITQVSQRLRTESPISQMDRGRIHRISRGEHGYSQPLSEADYHREQPVAESDRHRVQPVEEKDRGHSMAVEDSRGRTRFLEKDFHRSLPTQKEYGHSRSSIVREHNRNQLVGQREPCRSQPPVQRNRDPSQPAHSRRGHRKHRRKESSEGREVSRRREQSHYVGKRRNQPQSIGATTSSTTTSSRGRRTRARRVRSRRVHSKRRHRQRKRDSRGSEQFARRGPLPRNQRREDPCRSRIWCKETVSPDFNFPKSSIARSSQLYTMHPDRDIYESEATDEDAVYVGPCYRDDCEGDIYYKDPWRGKFYHQDSFPNAYDSEGSGGDKVPGVM